MQTLFLKKSFFLNEKIHKYSLQSINKSINKIVENYNEERKMKEYNLINKSPSSSSSKPDGTIIVSSFFFLSIASFLHYYFYNSKK
jgi:hypothetical protein